MSIYFSKEEENLLTLLKVALSDKNSNQCMLTNDINIQQVVMLAKKHAVLSLMYDEIYELSLPDEQKAFVEKECKQIVLQNYRLLFLTKYIVELLEKSNIGVVVLKGVSAAKYYPVSELRKSGDIDLLLLEPDKIKQVKQIMVTNNFRIHEEQLANHHISFLSGEGIAIEIHTMLAEPFDNSKTNQYLNKLIRNKQLETCTICTMGIEVPVLSRPYYAYELLLHMLQHFLRSGFGLKLLCDWVVFWNQDTDDSDKSVFLKLVEESGIKGFSDLITMICVRYLGLSEGAITWMNCDTNYPIEEFMREILDAEEFGKSGVERMVVMRGTGLWDLVIEFHHQMCLNFPKLSKCPLFWPVLWLITLVRFLYNNKKVRSTSAGEILKEARRRSELIKTLKIFQ